jgi:energy-converting hydrogenase Eha subunit C
MPPKIEEHVEDAIAVTATSSYFDYSASALLFDPLATMKFKFFYFILQCRQK